MKTFRLRFTLDADLITTIEAEDLNDAKDQLCRIDVRDIIDDSWINDYALKDIDYEAVEEEHVEINVSITDITWKLDDESPLDLPTEDIAEIKVDNYNGEIDSYDIDETIADYLEDTYGHAVSNFRYRIISKK